MSRTPTGAYPAQPGAWDDDPDAASILVATGRSHHDVLLVAEPALLTDLDEAWGRPASQVRLSFLPGISAPTTVGQADSLASYDRHGIGVLVARGRTMRYEGKPTRRLTSLARLAASAGVRYALIVSRACSLGVARPGDFLAVGDHLNLTGFPLITATSPVTAHWDETLTTAVSHSEGVRGVGVAALIPGPLRPTPAEAAMFARSGADIALMDGVAEAMCLATRGVRVAGLAYVDHAGAAGQVLQPTGRRAARGSSDSPRIPAPDVVRAAADGVVAACREW